jgi:hypothetical protein
MGRKDEAIAILQRAQRDGEDRQGGPIHDLRELLGDDPRYQKLMNQRSEARAANSKRQ